MAIKITCNNCYRLCETTVHCTPALTCNDTTINIITLTQMGRQIINYYDKNGINRPLPTFRTKADAISFVQQMMHDCKENKQR